MYSNCRMYTGSNKSVNGLINGKRKTFFLVTINYFSMELFTDLMACMECVSAGARITTFAKRNSE